MLAVLLRQLGVDEVPLGLEDTAEDRISGYLSGRFQLIQGGLGLQRRDIGRGQVEGGKFGHLVSVRIVNAADQHANMAHGVLLGQYCGAILPQSGPRPNLNLTQRLFALTKIAAASPNTLHRVGVDFTNAITIIVACPFSSVLTIASSRVWVVSSG
jgi:hypothetical protein